MKKIELTEDLIHALLILAGFIGFVVLGFVQIMVALSVVSFGLLLFFNRKVFKELKPFGGYANWVTIFRLALLCALGFSFHLLNHLNLAIWAIIVLSLDGVDGLIARKMSMTSEFGGKLDGETDAFFVLLMGSIVYQFKLADYWILWPGLLRYFFVISCYVFWKKTWPEPVSYFRKTIAVIIMSALISPFLLAEKFYLPIIIIATILVTYSFAKSFTFQWKQSRIYRS
ncbi:CDP-alcohol phosphatidyltransferase family protein [Fulvivirgaceae bacterium BMA12]|uniref:CDP-alcohol phosphatidyltransferase family protein n=1 Tax=Agaribacillus aureus TaxID=3051825 RepID=A0ABT8L717_9BACT|nr:CDP-alcohol phosphatidyltransferase family protein [Fulvivirgaceae bacterium BMA12]